MASYKCTLRSDGTRPQALRKVEASSEVMQPRVDGMVLSNVEFGHNVSQRIMSGKGWRKVFPTSFFSYSWVAPMGKKI